MTQELNDKDKWLAAEYALGVLEHDDLRLAEQRVDGDPVFRKAVEDWQQQLTPMLKDVAPVAPPAAVWEKIETRTSGETAGQTNSLWDSLAFWRGLSGVSAGLATAALAALLFLPGIGIFTSPQEEGKPLIATLTAKGEAPAFIARFDPETGALFVRTSAGDGADNRVPELWLIPDDGVPRSLGLLAQAGSGNLAVSKQNRSVLGDGITLAVSLEPAGGSPTGAPTGPVIATGKLQPL
ncbi:anti-sigma factor [Anderseniella sp. Alg231-50]|uniref:anti-sigma factor n=1 Tax=Anderseniella sp. Alg231-50 TaxID=1922226 RepID=UPI00307C58B4